MFAESAGSNNARSQKIRGKFQIDGTGPYSNGC